MGGFQFPSNGKADPNGYKRVTVSSVAFHEFQFPSNGKADPNIRTSRRRRTLLICFNSLQTGKQIQTIRSETYLISAKKVSIPFKRESRSKLIKKIPLYLFYILWVSIPFKRESRSKRRSSPWLRGALWDRFNSLQTGKQIQTPYKM